MIIINERVLTAFDVSLSIPRYANSLEIRRDNYERRFRRLKLAYCIRTCKCVLSPDWAMLIKLSVFSSHSHSARKHFTAGRLKTNKKSPQTEHSVTLTIDCYISKITISFCGRVVLWFKTERLGFDSSCVQKKYNICHSHSEWECLVLDIRLYLAFWRIYKIHTP